MSGYLDTLGRLVRSIGHPMKIPRIVSQHVIASLQVTGLLFTYIQLRPDVGGRRRTRSDGLDGSRWAHNPKVGDSNPPPAHSPRHDV